MNQTLPTADLNTAGTTDVIPSVAIDRIIAQRNEGIALFMQAMECLATARKILLDASGDIFLYGIRRQLVLPTRANYTGRTLQCDIKSRLLLPSLSFSCSFHLSVRTYIRDGSAGLPPPPP